MMDIPIHDQNPLCPVTTFQMLRRDRDRIKKTKAHGSVPQGVVAWRPDQRKAVAELVLRDRIYELQEAAYDQKADPE
jgi:hypothetical protein